MKKTAGAALATMLLWAGCASASEQAKVGKIGQLSLCNDDDVVYFYRKTSADTEETKPERLATLPCAAPEKSGQSTLSKLPPPRKTRTNSSDS